MSVLDAWRHRLRNLFRPGRAAAELEREMELYMELDAAQHARAGHDPALARREFGNATLWRERVWHLWRAPWLDALVRDALHAARLMRHRPRFAIAAFSVLTLGIAAGTTVFSIGAALRAGGQAGADGDPRFGLVLLMIETVVCALMLVACAGAANLMLARAAERRTELAIRRALGASRHEIVRHLAIDATVVAAFAGAAGYCAARAATAWTRDSLPPELIPLVPGWAQIEASAGVAAVMAIISTVVSVTIAAATALRARVAFAHAFVGIQVALTIVIVAAASLIARSTDNLVNASVGVRIADVWTVRTRLPDAMTAHEARLWYASAEHALRAMASVRDAAFVSHLPLTNAEEMTSIVGGRRLRTTVARRQRISPAYFATLDIPLVAGRAFTDENDTAARSAIVNGVLARLTWPGLDPIGRVIVADGVARTVVGVVGDVRHNGADGHPSMEIYLPLIEHPGREMDLAIRTAGASAESVAAIAAAVAAIDAHVGVAPPIAMEEIVRRHYAGNRLAATILSVFALVSVLITGFGLYGWMSQDTTRRQREIGMRIALGARARDIGRILIAPIAAPLMGGTACGLVGVVVVHRVLGSIAFEVTVSDAAGLMALGASLAMIATTGIAAPLLRALRVDPVESVRASDR